MSADFVEEMKGGREARSGAMGMECAGGRQGRWCGVLAFGCGCG